MRLNRFLSVCGLGSRRGCEQIILDGRVMINNKRVTDLGTQVADGDAVTVDGKAVIKREGVVIALNKPRGYLCTREDTHGRPTIFDLLPPRFQQLHHVGRLDQDSEGLILLTNRGELSQRLMHPSQGVDKEYEVRTELPFDQDKIFKLIAGMSTPEGFAKAERAWIENAYLVHVVLKQGLKRQIRHMFYQLGFEVERLTRVRIGGLKLHGMSKGSWRQITETEIEKLLLTHREGSRGAKASSATVGGDEDHFAPAKPSKRITKPGGRRPTSRSPRRASGPAFDQPEPTEARKFAPKGPSKGTPRSKERPAGTNAPAMPEHDVPFKKKNSPPKTPRSAAPRSTGRGGPRKPSGSRGNGASGGRSRRSH